MRMYATMNEAQRKVLLDVAEALSRPIDSSWSDSTPQRTTFDTSFSSTFDTI